MIDQKIQDRRKGCFYGLAIGDALGAAVEFRMPGEFAPVTCYRGLGPHHLNLGEWTDDTSMALALADSLVEQISTDGDTAIYVTFDEEKQLKNYMKWFQDGKYSVNGRCFDIGNTTRHALYRFEDSGEIESEDDADQSGNGSIMRLAPIPVVFWNLYPDKLSLLEDYAVGSSTTTHGSGMCKSACAYMAIVLAGLMNGESKETVLDKTWEPTKSLKLNRNIREVANGSFKTGNDIKGSGFVVKSLEAALWAFWNTNNFQDAVLRAVNLGDDADTTGAVAGQFAGALYGYSGIPQSLIEGLAKKDMIENYLSPLLAI